MKIVDIFLYSEGTLDLTTNLCIAAILKEKHEAFRISSHAGDEGARRATEDVYQMTAMVRRHFPCKPNTIETLR